MQSNPVIAIHETAAIHMQSNPIAIGLQSNWIGPTCGHQNDYSTSTTSIDPSPHIVPLTASKTNKSRPPWPMEEDDVTITTVIESEDEKAVESIG
jgi:hypothetical protein